MTKNIQKTKPGPKQAKYVFGFMDEVGVLHTPKEDQVFGLGLLKVHRPADLHRKIISYKNKVTFYNEFKFSNVRDGNLKMYKKFVDLFFETSSIEFSCIPFNKKDLDIDKFFRGNHHKAYNSFTALLISKSLEKSEYIAILADDISTPKSDNFEKEVKKKIKNKLRRNALFGICRLESHAVSEVQMVDVLLGIVAYAFKIEWGLVNSSRKNAKFKLMLHVQKHINTDKLARFNEYRLRYGRKFKIFEFPNKK